MARIYFLTLAIMAIYIGVINAQVPVDCLTEGQAILSDCQAERTIADSVYPLNSTVPATPEQVNLGKEKLTAANLPAPACCKSAGSFSIGKCQCDPTLQSILPTVGVEVVAVQSLTNVLGSACNFVATTC